jgi:hypothetical protein
VANEVAMQPVEGTRRDDQHICHTPSLGIGVRSCQSMSSKQNFKKQWVHKPSQSGAGGPALDCS